MDEPETTFSLSAETGKPNEASALEAAAERPELNHALFFEPNVGAGRSVPGETFSEAEEIAIYCVFCLSAKDEAAGIQGVLR